MFELHAIATFPATLFPVGKVDADGCAESPESARAIAIAAINDQEVFGPDTWLEQVGHGVVLSDAAQVIHLFQPLREARRWAPAQEADAIVRLLLEQVRLINARG